MIKQTGRGDKASIKHLNDVCSALSLLNEYKGYMDKKSGIADIQITQFSDSIVISFPWDKESPDIVFALSIIKHIQVRMLMSFKILLRGGIVIGDLIHNDKLLLGPGMVAAYELESKCAFSPRIVIDPKVAYRFRIVKNRLFAPEINEKRIIHKDMDDTCYIDYFNVDNSVLADEDQFEYFKLLCQMVANNVSSSEMSIRMKYLWMRNKIKNSEMYKRPGYAEIYKQIVTDNKK